jgi:hypothetical protein
LYLVGIWAEGIRPPGINFTNILRAAFRTKVFCAAFMCSQFGFVIVWQKDFGAKAAHKMLVKLTPGGRNWQLMRLYSFQACALSSTPYSTPSNSWLRS